MFIKHPPIRFAYYTYTKYIRLLILMTLLSGFLSACKTTREPASEKTYGVFLSIDASEIEKLNGYETVVIDAQYFSEQNIQSLHEDGTKVYTYLNIGSIENFRDYYHEYEDLTLGNYENWEEEKWIDVSDITWQRFINDLAISLSEKGVDGFFIDNCDVYYYKPDEEIFSGLTTILRELKSLGKDVIINGGCEYVTLYRQTYGSAIDIMNGINQEEVFSLYNFDNNSFEVNPDDEREYFLDYVNACKDDGMEVYLLEYSDDVKLSEQIKKYCHENGFQYYISDSIELD